MSEVSAIYVEYRDSIKDDRKSYFVNTEWEYFFDFIKSVFNYRRLFYVQYDSAFLKQVGASDAVKSSQ